jgi:hypothetical protein
MPKEFRMLRQFSWGKFREATAFLCNVPWLSEGAIRSRVRPLDDLRGQQEPHILYKAQDIKPYIYLVGRTNPAPRKAVIEESFWAWF